MKKFGLIGKNLEHSFSKKYFEKKFTDQGLNDYAYELFPIGSIQELPKLIDSQLELKGLNVTIPYKEEVLEYIDHLDFEAKKAGAVNTLYIKRKETHYELYGYNTDIIGFKKSLRPYLAPHHDRALILGTGGASKAVAVVLEEFGIPYLKVSRNPKEYEISYSDLNEFILLAHHLIVNTTPQGTFPNIENAPDIPYDLLNENHFLYDLTYNPEQSLFLKKGEAKSCLTLNGQTMLEFQAEAAWEIWNNFENKNPDGQ